MMRRNRSFRPVVIPLGEPLMKLAAFCTVAGILSLLHWIVS